MSHTTKQIRSDTAQFQIYQFDDGTIILTWRFEDAGAHGTVPIPADLSGQFVAAITAAKVHAEIDADERRQTA